MFLDGIKNLLVVAPHGLDEVLGVGGTIKRAAAAGKAVDLLVMFGDGQGRDALRRKSLSEVADLLGIRNVTFAGFPEGHSDGVPLIEMVGAVEKAIGEYEPEAVFTSHGGSLHVDHQSTCRATVTAARPVPGSTVKWLLSYEIQSSTEWMPVGVGADLFQPALYVDISDALAEKLKALELYGDEMRPEPHARSVHSAEALAFARGATVGVRAAEAFMVLRAVS